MNPALMLPVSTLLQATHQQQQQQQRQTIHPYDQNHGGAATALVSYGFEQKHMVGKLPAAHSILATVTALLLSICC
jgi:hypothetical protein